MVKKKNARPVFDFYGTQRLLASRILGLRAVCIDRPRLALTAGFRKGLREVYRLRAIRQGVIVVVAHEEAAQHSRVVATRLASTLLIPLEREMNFFTGALTLLNL